MARFVGRDNVRKRLAPLEGEPGRTTYADGQARIEAAEEVIVVRPPFGLAHAREYETVWLAPLLEALADDHIVAAVLVRLGGYAVGAAIQTERAQITKARGFVGGREVRGGSGVQPRRGCRDPAHACARSRRRRRDTGRYSGPACSAQGHALRTPTRGGRTLSEPQKPALVRDSSRLLADGGVSGSSVHVRARETAAACSLGAPSPR